MGDEEIVVVQSLDRDLTRADLVSRRAMQLAMGTMQPA
jgi:hypothetical protein